MAQGRDGLVTRGERAGLLLTVVVTIAGIRDRDGAVRLRSALRAEFSTIVLIWPTAATPDAWCAGRRRCSRSPSASSSAPMT